MMATNSRLQTALDDGSLVLPVGDVHVMRPPSGFDLSAIGDRDISISHGFAPDFAAWEAAGISTSKNVRDAAIQYVVVPRSKALARAMIAEAAKRGQIVLVDGQKTDGVDSLLKAVKAELGPLPSVTKAHGRLFWFEGTDKLKDWSAPPPAIGPHGFYTTAGVFSDGAIDKGSALLVGAFPKDLKGRIADFGAGWGYLAKAVLAHQDVTAVDLIEAEDLSLTCASLNIADPRAHLIWTDATQFRAAEPYDAIVMNPPFHQGRAGDPGLGQAFIASAARNLKPNGTLWMVANRHLPYEAELRRLFRNVAELSGNASFKVFEASRPKR